VTSSPASRTVRVFISSTFRDFGGERDLLMKRVFPELRRRARERFVEVIGVDLRWGITEEASQRGETLPICLREIERSRPYFLGLLGERYGWTPPADLYPEQLVAMQPWLREHAGGASVTELEILHGVLNNPEMAGRAFFHFRRSEASEARGPDFASEGEVERVRLGRLKARIRESGFPVQEFATPEELADRVTGDLWRLIDAEYPAEDVPDELERTRRSHEAYAAERRRLYVGQERAVAELIGRIEGASDEPGEAGSATRITVVTGESGTGKSALIANALAEYRVRRPEDVVIEHYVGSTTDASDPLRLMRRVAEEIRRLTGVAREIESDPEALVEQFATWLAEGAYWVRRTGGRLVLAMDALDKLSDETNLRWLPRILPPNLRIVVSTLEGESREILRKRQIVEVAARPFTAEVAREYLVETLARRGRTLPEGEIARIIAHPRATLPIYLKTLVEELSVFGSHEGLPERISECLKAKEPDDLFEVILERLEKDLGRDVVQKPLEAIWASPEGMSDDEIIGFTGVTPMELARMKLGLEGAVCELDGRVRRTHLYIARAIQHRYVSNDESQDAIHDKLARWWETSEESPRMAQSLLFHVYGIQDPGAQSSSMLRCLLAAHTGPSLLRQLTVSEIFYAWTIASRAASWQSEHETSHDVAESAMAASWAKWTRGPHADTCKTKALLKRAVDFFVFAKCKGQFAQSIVKDYVQACGDPEQEIKSLEELGDSVLAYQAASDFEIAAGDIESSIQYSEVQAKLCRRFHERSGTSSSFAALGFALSHLGNAYSKGGNLDAATASYRESLALARAMFAEDGRPWKRECLAVALGNVAICEMRIGNHRAALGVHREAVEELRCIVSLRETLESLWNLSLSLHELAVQENRYGSPAATNVALAECSNALREAARYLPDSRFQDKDWLVRHAGQSTTTTSIIERDIRILNAVQSLVETSDCEGLDSFDVIIAFLERHSPGRMWSFDLRTCRLSLLIARRRVQLRSTPESERILATRLHNLGFVLKETSDLAGARESLLECLEIEQRIDAGRDSETRCRRAIYRLRMIAEIDIEAGNVDHALVQYQQCLKAARRLFRRGVTPGFLNELEEFLIVIGDIELKLGRFHPANRRLRQRVTLIRWQWRGVKSLLHLNSLIWTLHLVGSSLLDADLPRDAESMLRRDRPRAEELERTCGEVTNHLDTCAAYWETLARAALMNGKSVDQVDFHAKAANLRRRIIDLAGGTT
jgi:tetratricopeptide (TPR) repeat protein